MIRAAFFDLDETLVRQEKAFACAYEDAGELAAGCVPVDGELLASSLPGIAAGVFRGFPALRQVRRSRFGGRDVLWGDPAGESGCLRGIAAAAAEYRSEVWSAALERQGVRDSRLAARLAERFPEMMLARVEAFPDAVAALKKLAGKARLGVITNGMPAAAEAKLKRLGLHDYFDAVVASASLGIGKPAREVFDHALRLAGASPEEAVMVGDSVEGDVLGAAGAGMRAIFVNRNGGRERERLPAGAREVADLSEVPSLIMDGAWRGGRESGLPGAGAG